MKLLCLIFQRPSDGNREECLTQTNSGTVVQPGARGERLDAHIVIGTPGTMLDWCTKLRIIDLKNVCVFVLDEADVMIDTQGHQDQSIRIQR